MRRNIGITIVLLIIAVAAIFVAKSGYFSKTNSTNQTGNEQRIVSHEFQGTLKAINNNIVSVNGVFMDSNNSATKQGVVVVDVIIDPQTKLVRSALILPTKKELAKTGGRFNTEKLKKEETIADLAILREDSAKGTISIFAKSNNNISGSSKFVATEIKYTFLKEPETQ